MREIKFRAWDKKKKEMFYSHCGGGGFCIFDSGEWRLGTIGYEWDVEGTGNKEFYGDGVLMQYTGLLDKNGKEIYEGDIVKIYTGEICKVVFPDGQGFFIDYYDNKKRSGFRKPLYDQIVFDGPSISWTPEGKMINNDYYEERKPEIIGNIYENEELISLKK